MKHNNEIQFIENCYKEYEHKMYYIAYSILHDVQHAEDAVQEAFMKLMKYDLQFEDYKSEECKKFIYTTIKNTSINMYRKKKREQEFIYLSDEEDTFSHNLTTDKMNTTIDIEELIERIPSKYSDVVRLLVIDNLSVKETANTLHISEVNVRKRFERAKKLIKKGSNENETGRIIYGTIHS